MNKNIQSSSEYNAEHITVLSGLEPVRKRPGMYIGSTGASGLHHLLWEVLDNAIDEAMAGFCNEIWIILHKDGSVTVIDNGRGIPVDIHPQTKKSALETVMCVLHAGGKFDGLAYKVSGGLHGVGVSVVNALSSFTRAEVARDGKIWFQEYSRGTPQNSVAAIGSIEEYRDKEKYSFPLLGSSTGTKITFKPDSDIFEVLDFNLNTIIDHIREQAYLTKGVKIKIIDERPELELVYTFYFEGGVVSYVKHLLRNKEPLFEKIIYINKKNQDHEVEVAFTYSDSFTEHIFTFANNINTPEGGSHLTGFKVAITRALNDYIKKMNLLKGGDEALSGDDVREGIVAIISCKVKNPQFEGQTKQKLGNPEVKPFVEEAVVSGFSRFLEENPQEARKIIEKAFLAQRARKAAKAARETVIKKGILEGLTLPGKLADCSSRKPEESELFIVEGDSAGGSAKQARDRRFQAILPLRGKILNVEKSRLDKILASSEIKALIVALGCGIGDQFDISKLRYHKIIIMTDADVDGAHIRTLLLTFFFRYMPEVIRQGYLYIAQPPLYKIEFGREVFYAYSDEDKERILEEIKNSAAGSEDILRRMNIQRYKGLGEMNPQQLWETTMNPENRVLLQVSIQDAQKADEIFTILMGNEVFPRKKFIQTHATKVRNLDI